MEVAGGEAQVLAMIGLWHTVDINASTPVPFPLIQMQRVFVLVYLLCLPFVMVDGNRHSISH